MPIYAAQKTEITTAATPTACFTVPAGRPGVVSVAVTNTHASVNANVKVYAGGMTTADLIHGNEPLNAGRFFERTGLPVDAGEIIYVEIDAASVAVRVSGFDDVTA